MIKQYFRLISFTVFATSLSFLVFLYFLVNKQTYIIVYHLFFKFRLYLIFYKIRTLLSIWEDFNGKLIEVLIKHLVTIYFYSSISQKISKYGYEP